ncbi:MAG: hypothetical protein IT436_02510 [Phycisphaerales bacterium]|nr:hypothetical protein [Phycisphaerales bacterium]
MPPARPGPRIEHFNPDLTGFAGPRAEQLAWARAIAEFDEAKPRLIKQDGPVTVWRANLLAHDVAVKRWLLNSPSDLVKAAARRSRADRQWHGARWLAAHGLRTATPIAVLADRASRWLITEWIDGPTVLERLAAAPGPLTEADLDALADALGSQIAQLVNQGRFNRDHKPSNLILARARPGPTAAGRAGRATPPPIAIVDTVAIRRVGPAPGARARAAARMLASLIIEPTGVGHPPAASWLRRAAESCAHGFRVPAAPAEQLARRLLRLAEQRIGRHGDPTPRTDPLRG